jgi:CrcB protein
MFVDRQFPSAFPWGIFLVNMTGCLLFGLAYAVAENRTGLSGDVRGIVLTGFMGAFTTYSTFAFQSAQFIEKSQWGLAAANIVSQNVLGVVCVFAGFALGRMLS